MLMSLAALISIFHLASTEDPMNTGGSEVVGVNTCDDSILQRMQQKIDLLQITLQNTTEKLRLDMDTQNILLNNIRQHQIDESTCHPPNKTQLLTPIPSLPTNCAEATQASGQNGPYKIRIADSIDKAFYVYCLMDENNSDAWMVIQRRQNGKIDFYRDWIDYQQGFGNLESEFFIGLDKLHALTQNALHELWIQMEDFEGDRRWARYSSFAIGGASEDYALNILGKYIGDAGDSLSYHEGMKWTTKDKDNDLYETDNCAEFFNGAWWYNNCMLSNLNGQYLHGEYSAKNNGKGVGWSTWRGHNYSLKYVHMAIRPVQ